MRRVLVVSFLALTTAAAAAKPPEKVQCSAAYEVSCDDKGCKPTIEGPAPVAMSYSPSTGAGELCTYTFCRPVLVQGTLAPVGGSVQTGTIISGGREGPQGLIPGPDIEGVFTLSDKRDRFSIVWPGDGGATIWGGRCEKAK